MPVCQYIRNGETITKQMHTPRKITVMQSWFNDARKVIPQIPPAQMGVFVNNDWMIEHQEADLKWVKYDLRNQIGERAYIVILR